MSSKRIGVILIMSFLIISIIDLASVDGLSTVDASVIYDILVMNLTLTAISGIIIFLGIVIYRRIKK